jgi:genome maintenance exonuclease 1
MGAVNDYYRDYDIKLNHALLVVAIPEMAAEIFCFDSEVMNNYWQQWQKRVAEYWKSKY